MSRVNIALSPTPPPLRVYICVRVQQKRAILLLPQQPNNFSLSLLSGSRTRYIRTRSEFSVRRYIHTLPSPSLYVLYTLLLCEYV